MLAGIDLSSFAVDVAVVPLDTAIDPRSAYRHERLELRTRRDTGPFAAWMAVRGGYESIHSSSIWDGVQLAFIEHGAGHGAHATYLLGLVAGLVAAAVPDHVLLWPIEQWEWKLELLGKGFGNCRAPVYVGHLRVAGYQLPDENAYAALGIALAGRAMNARAVHEHEVARQE